MIRLGTTLDRLLVLLLLIGLWQTLSAMLGLYWVSSPYEVAKRLLADLGSAGLLRHASYTLEEALLGFAIGAAPAMLLPFLLRRQPLLTAILDPFMAGGYGMPKLALAPLFILWFGIGVESKVALVASAVFFIVYFSTLAGIRALDPRLVQMAQLVGAKERQVLWHIVLPGAVPQMISGMRVALPYAIGGAVIAELISSNRGLGYLIQFAAMSFDTTEILVVVLACTIITLGANWSVGTVERHLLRWRPPSEAWTVSEAGGA